MPYLNLKVSQKLSAQTQEILAAELTRLMVDILHKEPTLTAITIEALENCHWFINAQLQPLGAYLSIHITQHTNTAAEKAQMLEATAALLNQRLGQLPTASYIVIHELPADNWGYAGRTQAARTASTFAETVAIEYADLNLDDIDKIMPLWQQLNQLHVEKSPHFSDCYVQLSFTQRKHVFIEKAKLGSLLITVAKQHEQPIGYCVSSVVGEVGEIESLFIDSNYRGHDVGAHFLTQAAAWMDTFRVNSKRIVVYAGNEAVLSFYEKFGFHTKYLILEQVNGN